MNVSLPFLLWFIDDQEDLELLRRCDLGLLHEPCRGSCLLNNVGDGAEEPRSGGLRRLGFPLRSGRGGRRCGPSCGRLGRSGGGRWRRLSGVRPLEVCHVAIGQVGDERAVRETATQIIHGCRSEGRGINQGWMRESFVEISRRRC